MSHLINIFLEPAKVFAALKDKPTFVVPFLVLVGAIIVSTLSYFMTVDPAWFSEHQTAQMLAQNPELTKEQIAQAKAFMPGARMSGYIAAPSAAIFMAIVFAVYGLYYLLAGKVTGQAISYKQGLALAAWSSMPMVLASLVVIGGVLTSSNQTPFESLQMLNIDPLLVQLPLDHDWSTFAKSFSLLNFWTWFLAALGWKTWFRTGWGQAVFVAILPSLVIYGVMILFAVL